MNGVLIVNKEKDYTSRDVVNIVSKVLNTKKIGHTGTLDPIAEGVLVLTIGKATKLGEVLTSNEKEYIATVKRGILTDTLDTTGEIIETSEIKDINLEELVKSYEKTYMQEVPKYSAVKVNGKKLYEYARNNKEVELPKKEVIIKKMELLNDNPFTFKCKVSKGTYIRSLIRDMGKSINEDFTMSSLIRTKQGKFSINDSYTLEDIKNGNYKILSIEEVLDDLEIVNVDDMLLKKVSNGVRLDNKYNKEFILFKDNNDKEISIYRKENNCYKMYIML